MIILVVVIILKIVIEEGTTELRYKFIAPANATISEWVTISDWSDCSAVCGDGIQTRSIMCQENGQTVDDKQCILSKPITNRICTAEHPCEHYSWTVTDWSQVQPTCMPCILLLILLLLLLIIV